MALRMESLRLGRGFRFRARSSSLVGWATLDWRIGLESRLLSRLHLLWTHDLSTQSPLSRRSSVTPTVGRPWPIGPASVRAPLKIDSLRCDRDM
jgi:hypothetical protein